MKNSAYEYDYTGGEQTFTAPCNGYYKLEVWGAQGGLSYSGSTAGYGGYSTGITRISYNDNLYINVGGAGSTVSSGTGGGITKHMTCYSCTTSSVAATRTNSNTNVSATATADYSKTGNGYAKITYLGPTI
ncbi:MAG: glycine rich domain-containing protein [Candidatus Saccharibacteria bacterium]|nr:glycine rich domain-containing protein [Candidatus Saccharibacteria bacterium]